MKTSSRPAVMSKKKIASIRPHQVSQLQNGKFGVTPNLETPKTPTEKKVVECFAALEAAERKFHEGLEFGRAVIELRAEAKGQRNWMERLKQLGISYEKARYWIAVVERKPTQRNKAAKAKLRAQELDVPEWHAAQTSLKTLVTKIEMLRRREVPKAEDVNAIKALIEELAGIFGYQLVEKKHHAVMDKAA